MSIFGNIVYKDGKIVDNSWIKWIHFGVPDEEGAERELKEEIWLLHYIACVVQLYRGAILLQIINRKNIRIVIVGKKLFQNLKMKVEQLVIFERLQSIFLMKDIAIKVKINYLLY